MESFGERVETIIISDDEQNERAPSERSDATSEEGLTEPGRMSSELSVGSMGLGWRPWKTEKDIQKDKDQEDLLVKATSGVFGGKFVICHLHKKQRLVDKMIRVHSDIEKYECPPDSICHVREENSATPGGGKRYYGSMRDVVAKRRNWKKVCWECGLGEHEKYDCPNKLDPVTANPTQYTRGNRNDYAQSWRPERHYVSKSDMENSYCIICNKKGSVNCCSNILTAPLSCASCTGLSHHFDECTLAQTNYHGRPSFDRKGGKGKGKYYDQHDRRSQGYQTPGRYPTTPDGYSRTPDNRDSFPSTPDSYRGARGPRRPPVSVGLPSPVTAPPASVHVPQHMMVGMQNAGRHTPPPPMQRRGDDYEPPSFRPYPTGGKGGKGKGRGGKGRGRW